MEEILDQAIAHQTIDVDKFLAAHSSEDSLKCGDSGNLLHLIVEKIRLYDTDFDILKPLVQKVAEKFPQLLVHQEQQGCNPLQLAARHSVFQFVHFILSTYKNNANEEEPIKNTIKEYLDKAILQENKYGMTILHTLFSNSLHGTKRDLDFDTVRMLIEHTSDEGLAAKDTIGNTPMHHVAAYQYCTPEGLEIVRLLINRDQNVTQRSSETTPTTFLDQQNMNGQSIYQMFIGSKNILRSKKKIRKAVDQNQQKDDRNNVLNDRGNFTTGNEEKSMETVFQEMSSLLKQHYMRTRNHEKTTRFLYGENEDDIQISFNYDDLPTVLDWDRFLKIFGADSKTGLKFDTTLQSVTFPQADLGFKIPKRTIQLELGLRPETFPQADAAFEVPESSHGLYRACLPETFRPGVRVFKECEAHIIREAENNREQLPAHPAIQYFFEWLYNKGVRHIIKLSVGGGDSYRVVDVIQWCLRQFKVERLDWRKLDLNPDILLHAWPESKEMGLVTPRNPSEENPLKELWLRWSGNVSILDAWSVMEGLPMLPNLKVLHVYTPEYNEQIDPGNLTARNLEKFQKELKENSTKARSSIPIADLTRYIESCSENAAILSADLERFIKSHPCGTRAEIREISMNIIEIADDDRSQRWLVSTSKFANAMKPFWENTLGNFKKWTGNDVVVALIDDGVDMVDETLHNQVLIGTSFDYDTVEKGGELRPASTSAKGHGTVMANMILHVCPMAKIYPIRIPTKSLKESGGHIDRKIIAKAIKAAVENGATIICMPWKMADIWSKEGIPDDLYHALDGLEVHEVQMFYPVTQNEFFEKYGGFTRPWSDTAFPVADAHADGSVSTHKGFIFPGADAIMKQIQINSSKANPVLEITSRASGVKFQTNASVSTALAAGVAAMHLYTVKATIMNAHMSSSVNSMIRSSEMEAAIQIFGFPGAIYPFMRKLTRGTLNELITAWDKRTRFLESSPAYNMQKMAEYFLDPVIKSFKDLDGEDYSIEEQRLMKFFVPWIVIAKLCFIRDYKSGYW
ncbi:hypothetical protein TrVFT333_007389 [Trichoderma virens FT-333]|nr:hypothetical protein TrVFT333_007389 [Trichoderma virens FT-333]